MEVTLANWDGTLTLLGLVLLAVLIASFEVGYLLSRARIGKADVADDGMAVVVGGLLALMSFVLAFNLGTATTRMEDRRDTALQEATAISTAIFQARALAGPDGKAIGSRMTDYLAARRDLMRVVPDTEASILAAGTAAALRDEILTLMTDRLARAPDVQAVNLSYALTNAFDHSTAQDFALASGLPPRLIWLLLISSSLAIGGLGYFLGVTGRRRLGLTFVLASVWSGVMVLILDLGTPSAGTINADLRPYDWALNDLAAQGHIPAMPPSP